LRVRDKFGDTGLTGLIIVIINGETADIDTFLLSCRILGKEIEYAFMAFILTKLKNAGFKKITAAYLKTSKNGQVVNFYDKLGFEVTGTSLDYKKYLLNLNANDFFVSSRYKLEEA
jgi:predicted enzyme involved in methoxymalonyl-ACP biosynthesis